MDSQKKRVPLLTISIGLAVVFILFGPVGITAAAQAREKAVPERRDLTLPMQASPNDIILIAFTDTSPIPYTDLSGNLMGEGVLVGELVCVGDVCNQKIEFAPAPEPVVYEYKFKNRQAFDPQAELVVAAGSGTISSSGPKMKFSFSAVFQKNPDGTVQVTFTASRPDASFAFPAAPGTFTILSNK